uniref:Tumor necrosis factor receptor superfamily, member 1B n=1 Tax=Neogobius melanostomus TaxID=47308 RepID=A0A8C6SV93_9GOBI
TTSHYICVLFFRQTRSLPYVVDTNHNCSAPDMYVREGTDLCCSRCPPGYKLKRDCNETHDTDCEPCGTGQFMEKWNYSPNCLSCPRCKEAKGLQYAVPCSSTTRAKCDCMPGRYCYMRNNQGCQECVSYKTCKQGFGVSVPGTLNSDARCLKCPEGTFSDTVSFTDTCKPHTTCDERDIISKGNATSDTVCNSVASTKPALNTKPETVISTAATQLWQSTTVKSKSLPITTANTTIPAMVPYYVLPGKSLPCFHAFFLLLFNYHVYFSYFFVYVTQTNHCYHGDTHHLSVITVQPEQQCLLQNGTADKHNCIESIETLQSTLPLHQPESALSEPLPLQSNVYPSVSQHGLTAQTSSQPTSPQNMTPSPLVNVNINLHIGNGTCSSPAVLLKDMPAAEPKIPFGEEEESCSLLQQEDGKPSVLSVEESGHFNSMVLKTLDQFV